MRIPKGNNAIFFIPIDKVVNGKTIAYGCIVEEIRPHKSENRPVWLSVGRYRLDFDGVTATQCTGLETTKMLFNSTVSTPGARFGTFDIKDFYYGIPMEEYDYMQVHFLAIPQDIIYQYNLEVIQHDSWVYI